MDIYFCDECGTRVSDLDLRGGKGMRQRNDVICSGCVDQGHAAGWMARTGQAPAASGRAAAQVNGSAAAVAVAEPSDVISVARDRASTLPDDPFADEAAVARKPQPNHETDAIPAAPPRPATPKPSPAAAPASPPVDGFAAAAGGFDALAGSAKSGAAAAEDGGADDLADRADAEDPSPAAPETPFDSADEGAGSDSNPGKAVTAEVTATPRDEKAEKPDKPARPASGRHQSPSGRQAAQKRGAGSSSKRGTSTRTTRKMASNPLQSKKMMLWSLVSCGAMIIIFFGVVWPQVNKPHTKAPTIENNEPAKRLEEAVNEAKQLCGSAMQSNDIETVRRAVQALRRMDEAFYSFKSYADRENWNEDNYAQHLRMIGFNDVKSMSKAVRERMGILEQQQK